MPSVNSNTNQQYAGSTVHLQATRSNRKFGYYWRPLAAANYERGYDLEVDQVQLIIRSTGNAEFAVCQSSERKQRRAFWRTHLVVRSPSAPARWTSQTTLPRQTRHSGTRNTGCWVRLPPWLSRARSALAGGASITSQSAWTIIICVIYLPYIIFSTVNCLQRRSLLCFNDLHGLKNK